MGVKMDNIITGQQHQALEVKLDLVNQQVRSNKGDIEQLKKTADFVSEQLTQATCVTKENVKKTADIDKDVDFLMNKMQSLEAEVNATERYSRSYNARFLGVPEITSEQCAKGLYRENAIAIEGEARDPFGGNAYYVTIQITFHIPEFARKERNLHCDVVHVTTKWVSRLVLDHAIAAIQTSR